jgi:hypothetical protein
MNLFAKIVGKQPDDTNISYSAEERKIFVSSFRIGWTVVAFGVGGLCTIALWGWGINSSGRPFTSPRL